MIPASPHTSIIIHLNEMLLISYNKSAIPCTFNPIKNVHLHYGKPLSKFQQMRFPRHAAPYVILCYLKYIQRKALQLHRG